MADDVEVDIEGIEDDGQPSSLDLHADPNVPPSSSTNLLSEFADPPWLLEQEPSWSLNDEIDDKSRETIEKMLLEEELYFQGRSIPSVESSQATDKPKSSTSNKPSSSKSRGRKPLFSGSRANRLPSHKMPWTEEEKAIFEQGMEIYGRSWTRIAQLITTRTTLQVKNYANQYFKIKAREKERADKDLDMTSPLETEFQPQYLNTNDIESQEEALAAVSTAVPTITTLPKISDNHGLTKSPKMKSPKLGKKIGRPKKSNSRDGGQSVICHEEIQGLENSGLAVEDQSAEKTLGELLEVASMEAEAADASKDETDQKGNQEEEEVDVEVDIDGDDEDEMNDSNLLKGSSLSPETIYSTLLKSAEEDSEVGNTETDSDSLQATEYDSQGKSLSSCDSVLSDENVAILRQDKKDKNTPGQRDAESDLQMMLLKSNDSSENIVEQTDRCSSKAENELGRVELHCSTENDHCKSEDSLVSGRCGLTIADNNATEYTSAEFSEDDNLVDFAEKIYKEEKPDPWAHIPKATEEIFLERSIITEDEKSAHPEFFNGRQLKTPQRYLKIRNYILESWDKTKPNYLTKTSVRPGLKNCGDVNCISRVHEYLEHIGAINFGIENPYRSTKAAASTSRRTFTKDELIAYQAIRMQTMRPRKRKIRDAYGNWIDADEAEGQTIDHDGGERQSSEDSRSARSRPKYNKLTTYDPFKLVPCNSFTADKPAPFNVNIGTDALLIMDVHSHLATTEVIGLLGGTYRPDLHHLEVSLAEPCQSLSTGLQCEMDPVSQTQACELIRKMGYDIVGWYHSHPRFAPNPSVRDIETQSKYQEWFGQGNAPFIGVIVSPYNRLNTRTQSQFRCLTVSNEISVMDKHRLPYQFEFTVSNQGSVNRGQLTVKMVELIEKFSTYHHRVNMLRQYRSDLNISYLEKMLESIKSYCHINDESDEYTGLLASIRDTVILYFSEKHISKTISLRKHITKTISQVSQRKPIPPSEVIFTVSCRNQTRMSLATRRLSQVKQIMSK
ncbi:histone H2A deubiquitinase MYSM1-like [Ptychodera flava]|uniref:histone H2A deubiquitinase MYSM1-like n=1 Tax=Ptychodera flava TaxID=63121 RepID=UPI00396A94BF